MTGSRHKSVRQLLAPICPHWWRELPTAESITFETTEHKVCRICKTHRIHARVPEPHPTRSKSELVEELQQPGMEFIVDEWLPYGSMGPGDGKE